MNSDYYDFPSIDGFDDNDMILALQLQMEYELTINPNATWFFGDQDYDNPGNSGLVDCNPSPTSASQTFSIAPRPILPSGPAEASPSPRFDSHFSLPSTPNYPPVTPLASRSPSPLKRNTFNCSVCFDDHTDDDIADISSCHHTFCRDCLRSWITSKINDHRFPIFCPSCAADRDIIEPGVITESLIEEIWIPEKEYQIFEEMQLSSLSLQLHCRRCKQSMYVARDDYDRESLIACPLPNCGHRWCSACQQSLEVDEYEHSCDTNATFDDLVQQSGWKYCPGCRTPIQKESGCNHMTCLSPGCNTNFCYICGELIIRSALPREIETATVAHYRQQGCELFEEIPDRNVPP